MGDVLEDIAEQRAAEQNEWWIRFTITWQLFFGLRAHFAVLFAWLVSIVRKIMPG